MFESSQVIDVNCLKTFNLKVVIYLVKVPQRTNHRCLTTELNNETCVGGSDNSTIYFVRGQGVYMIGGRGTPSSPSPAHSKTCCRFRVACSRSVRAIPHVACSLFPAIVPGTGCVLRQKRPQDSARRNERG